ncbi:MAG TPA: hypothetical protein VFZ19_06065 [Solirubrobacterales bacterium]
MRVEREEKFVSRAVVYESPAVQAHYAELVKESETPTLRRTVKEGALLEEAREKAATVAPPMESTKDGSQGGKDSYLEKIAKYVPAEIVTLTTLAVAALQPAGDTIWVIVLVGALANILYLFGTALADATTPLPRWYFYPLCLVAYAMWAAAIIPQFGDKVGIGGENAETEQAFALALAAFLVPLLDSISTNFSTRLRPKKVTEGGGSTPAPAATASQET